MKTHFIYVNRAPFLPKGNHPDSLNANSQVGVFLKVTG